MHLKLLRAAAAVAVLGGTATFGLGVQAAMAQPTFEPCGTDLTTVITNTTTGTFTLAPGCTYWVTSQLTVMHAVTIIGNYASIVRSDESDPFSIFVVGCANGDLTLYNVNVRNGGGDSIDGGAIHMDYPGTVNIYGGIFSNNTAVEGEGGGYGGAVYNLGGTLNVNGTIFLHNSASNDGGAVYSDNDDATLNHSTYANNSAEYGGAIYNLDSNMTIGQSAFRFNQAVDGGAIYNDWDVTINGTQFTLNHASDEGGAIYNNDSTVTMNHSTVTVNRALNGGGGIENVDAGTVTLGWNLILANAPDNCEPIGTITGCFH